MSESIDNLRIVVFGGAGTGKSSLLGALAQASTSPEQRSLLGGELADASGELGELQKRTYDKQAETHEAIVPYRVTLADGASATLMDCAGGLAQEYLGGQRSLADKGDLACAIAAADAVVVAASPSSDQAQLERTFSQCADFLRQFESQRGRGYEIAGLPVYLVLTKCDLLAKKDDTHTSWMQRVEEGKRKIGKRFQEFLERHSTLPFGSVDLHLWATAIRRPALSDRPARPQEPYGVAELFRQVLDEARAFRGQRLRAGQRLHWAVASLLALLVVLGLVGAAFFAVRPSAELTALENAVHASLPPPAAKAADRLREPVEQRLKDLTKIRDNPLFPQLPSQQQADVRTALDEMEAYQEEAAKVDALKRVRFFRKDEELDAGRRALAAIELPAKYAAPWKETRLAGKIEQYRTQLDAVDKALTEEKAWLKKQVAEGETLPKLAISGEGTPERQAWIDRADRFLKRKDVSKNVPGVPNMKLRDLYDFPSVSALREDYERARPRVEKIRGGLQ